MQVNNQSPFPYFAFESVDARDAAIEVIVCRGTFDIDGAILKPSAQQEPVVLADQYRGGCLTSSVKVDSDLVPHKPAADVTFNAIAHTPCSTPLASWSVSVRVGHLSKQLRVLGPRWWQFKTLKGWTLSEPEPVASVPIEYERAFGGRYHHEQEEFVFEQNPVGCGFVSRLADRSKRIAAPQIEQVNQPIVTFGTEYEPAGLGPIAKHWLPRRSLCGTPGDRWKETRWPLRPLDFDFRYYNCASPGLVYPGYLAGDEDVLLTGLSADGPVSFRLPDLSLTIFALRKNNDIILQSMVLDTLHIDIIAMKVWLTWRLTLPKTSALKSIQIVQESCQDTKHPALS